MTGRVSVSGFSTRTSSGVASSGHERAVAEGWAQRTWDRDATLWSADEPRAGDDPSGWAGWTRPTFSDGRRRAAASPTACGRRASAGRAVRHGRQLARAGGDRGVYGVAPGTGIAVEVLDSTDPDRCAGRASRRSRHHPVRHRQQVGHDRRDGQLFEALWELEERTAAVPPRPAGEHFAAITDPGHSLEPIPHREAYRTVLLNPADVGGRYSALTYVGLRARQPSWAWSWTRSSTRRWRWPRPAACPAPTTPASPWARRSGRSAAAGRDKVTFCHRARRRPVRGVGGAAHRREHRQAGRGPRAGRRRAARGARGLRRSTGSFVRLAALRAARRGATPPARSSGGPRCGRPPRHRTCRCRVGLGAEFFRWEFATAVAGAVLGVNPFDEPNVTESKENTARPPGRVPARTARCPTPAGRSPPRDRSRSFGDGGSSSPSAGTARPRSCASTWPAWGRTATSRSRPSSRPRPERDRALAAIRLRLRDATHRATTVGYGPRFLHSTGQLHKGGPPSGCFLQLTADHPDDVPIPGAGRSFGTLIDGAGGGRSWGARGARAARPAHPPGRRPGRRAGAALDRPRMRRRPIAAADRDRQAAPWPAVPRAGTGGRPNEQPAARRPAPGEGARAVRAWSSSAAPATCRIARSCRPSTTCGAGLLPAEQTVVAFARRPYTDERTGRRCRVGDGVLARSGGAGAVARLRGGHLLPGGRLPDQAAYAALGARLEALDAERGTRGNRLFYLPRRPAQRLQRHHRPTWGARLARRQGRGEGGSASSSRSRSGSDLTPRAPAEPRGAATSSTSRRSTASTTTWARRPSAT